MLEAPEHLQTDRLILRRWQDGDLEALAAINSDARTMEYFPSPLTFAQSAALLERIRRAFILRHIGFWAIELKKTGKLIGFSGLTEPTLLIHCAFCFELGYRIHHHFWGNGYGTEAASKAIEDGFTRLPIPEIFACTASSNKRSRKVMEKLGMQRELDYDFFHPGVSDGHPLKPHVLYRLTRNSWLKNASAWRRQPLT
jgi:RimJ/RimL family protein N-acetyltransferase